jgi:hypothetical protein
MPMPTMGQVKGRLPACILRMNRPVTENTSVAAAKMSMNQLQAAPVWRPLCRSFEIREPAAVSAFVFDLPVGQAEPQPGVAAGAR